MQQSLQPFNEIMLKPVRELFDGNKHQITRACHLDPKVCNTSHHSGISTIDFKNGDWAYDVIGTEIMQIRTSRKLSNP